MGSESPKIGQNVFLYFHESASPIDAIITHVYKNDDKNGRIDVEYSGYGSMVPIRNVWQNSNDDPEGPFWRMTDNPDED